MQCGTIRKIWFTVGRITMFERKNLQLSVKTCCYERKYRANVRDVHNSGALYSLSSFYGRSENYGNQFMGVNL